MSNPAMMQAMTNPDMINQLLTMQNAMGGMQLGAAGAHQPSAAAPGGLPTNPAVNPAAANPWAALGGMGGFGAAAPAAAAPPMQNPELMYQSQLSQLVEMGFGDAAANLRALLATGGNVN